MLTLAIFLPLLAAALVCLIPDRMSGLIMPPSLIRIIVSCLSKVQGRGCIKGAGARAGHAPRARRTRRRW